MQFSYPKASVLSVLFNGCLLSLLVIDVEVLSFHLTIVPIIQQQSQYMKINTSRGTDVRLYNTGGWGIGPQRELTPEEFATGGAQNKKYFEGYQIRNRGEFMRQVAQDKESMIRGEIDELLGVAAAAGITVKDPKERLNKFDPSLIQDDEYDDANLDLSVQWDDDNNNNNNNDSEQAAATTMDETETKTIDRSINSESITRLDEDTGALGVW